MDLLRLATLINPLVPGEKLYGGDCVIKGFVAETTTIQDKIIESATININEQGNLGWGLSLTDNYAEYICWIQNKWKGAEE